MHFFTVSLVGMFPALAKWFGVKEASLLLDSLAVWPCWGCSPTLLITDAKSILTTGAHSKGLSRSLFVHLMCWIEKTSTCFPSPCPSWGTEAPKKHSSFSSHLWILPPGLLCCKSYKKHHLNFAIETKLVSPTRIASHILCWTGSGCTLLMSPVSAWKCSGRITWLTSTRNKEGSQGARAFSTK